MSRGSVVRSLYSQNVGLHSSNKLLLGLNIIISPSVPHQPAPTPTHCYCAITVAKFIYIQLWYSCFLFRSIVCWRGRQHSLRLSREFLTFETKLPSMIVLAHLISFLTRPSVTVLSSECSHCLLTSRWQQHPRTHPTLINGCSYPDTLLTQTSRHTLQPSHQWDGAQQVYDSFDSGWFHPG